MTLSDLPILLADAPGPIQLLTGAEPAATPAASNTATAWWVWWVGVVGLAAMLALGATMLFQELTRFRDESPEETAFRKLSERLGLRKDHQALIRRLAESLGAQPVALLLSEYAFEQSLEAAGDGADVVNTGDSPGLPPVDNHLAAETRRMIFGATDDTAAHGALATLPRRLVHAVWPAARVRA